MSISQPTSDYIEQLPIDQTTASKEEIEIVDRIFKKENTVNINKIADELKESILVAILVIVMIKIDIAPYVFKLSPQIGSSEMLLLFLKGVVAGLVFYFIKNLNSIKRK